MRVLRRRGVAGRRPGPSRSPAEPRPPLPWARILGLVGIIAIGASMMWLTTDPVFSVDPAAVQLRGLRYTDPAAVRQKMGLTGRVHPRHAGRLDAQHGDGHRGAADRGRRSGPSQPARPADRDAHRALQRDHGDSPDQGCPASVPTGRRQNERKSCVPSKTSEAVRMEPRSRGSRTCQATGARRGPGRERSTRGSGTCGRWPSGGRRSPGRPPRLGAPRPRGPAGG